MHRFGPAQSEDKEAIRALLETDELPTKNLAEALPDLLVARQDDAIIGCVGLESAGESVLLRSLAVAAAHRGRGLGTELFTAMLSKAQEAGMKDLYLLTETAQAWFRQFGFVRINRKDAPKSIANTSHFTELCPETGTLMWRRCEGGLRKPAADVAADLFDAGYYCAEAVLLAIAERRGVYSPLIPGIATGLCGGLSRTGGQCGALAGAVLALDLELGRDARGESVEENYAAVQKIVAGFEERFGVTSCPDLIGCDLATEAGQRQFREQGLAARCREFVRHAAELASGS